MTAKKKMPLNMIASVRIDTYEITFKMIIINRLNNLKNVSQNDYVNYMNYDVTIEVVGICSLFYMLIVDRLFLWNLEKKKTIEKWTPIDNHNDVDICTCIYK